MEKWQQHLPEDPGQAEQVVCNTRREESFWSPSLRVQIAVEVVLTGNRDNTVYQTSVPFPLPLSLSLFFFFFKYLSLVLSLDPNSWIRYEPKAAQATLTVWLTAPSISVLNEHDMLSSGFSNVGQWDLTHSYPPFLIQIPQQVAQAFLCMQYLTETLSPPCRMNYCMLASFEPWLSLQQSWAPVKNSLPYLTRVGQEWDVQHSCIKKLYTISEHTFADIRAQ